LWDSRLLYPLKVLTVFFHEISHGLASVATGGDLIAISLSHHEGGAALTAGGSPFLILNAGYLGSLVFGGLLLAAASRGRQSRAIMAGLGGVLIGIGVWFVRPIFSFGLFYCLVFGALLLYSGRKLPEWWNQAALQIIGLTSCLYAVNDIVSDTILRGASSSDAQVLGRYTHIPGVLWGIFWLAAALYGAYFFLKLSVRRGRKKWRE
jgi:hypothetical protein